MDKNRNEVLIGEGQEFEPFILILDILKNIGFILMGALAAAMITYVAVNMKYVPEYTSSTTFIVGAKGSNDMYSNAYSAGEMAKMLEKILQSHKMEELLCDELDVDAVDANIRAEAVSGTNMVVLSVTAGNPKEAFDVIRAIMDNYSEVSYYAIGNAVMNVLVEPEIPFSPDNYLDVRGPVKKAFYIGLFVCAALFGLLSYMSDTIKTERGIEQKLDAKSFGEIKFEQKHKSIKGLFRHSKAAVLVDNPLTGFAFVEGYKKLASKLEYKLAKDKSKILVVTSVSENEGKSTVAANLAITLVEQGKKVVLVDGDIRRPSQFLIFGLDVKEENELGEFLKGEENISNVLMKGSRKGLYFIGGKNCYSSSTEILQSDRLGKMLQFFKENSDFVIIDTPPAGLLADAQIFAKHADGVLLVVRQNFIPAEDINEIIDDFHDHHTKVLGVVLNSVQSFSNIISNTTGGYYGQYSRYGKYSGNKGR